MRDRAAAEQMLPWPQDGRRRGWSLTICEVAGSGCRSSWPRNNACGIRATRKYEEPRHSEDRAEVFEGCSFGQVFADVDQLREPAPMIMRTASVAIDCFANRLTGNRTSREVTGLHRKGVDLVKRNQ